MQRQWSWIILLAVAIPAGGCEKKSDEAKSSSAEKENNSKSPGGSAHVSTRKAILKKIGISFHNFDQTFGHFPEHGSNGNKKGRGRKAGLSWRVHLLPFLEEQALYDQFKLDEPWDSPHNKKLISKMPEILLSPDSLLSRESGKTRFHVFVGKGTPFRAPPTGADNARGSFIRDFADGVSNTLLVVETGDDKADIWTKPGGLPFDAAKNPVELLGKTGPEFLMLLCDGSVYAVKKSIKPETLKLLIQFQDGNLIPKDPAFPR